jgi:hypothetical protein
VVTRRTVRFPMLNVLLQATNRGRSVLSIFRHLGAFGLFFLTILDSSPLPTFGGPDILIAILVSTHRLPWYEYAVVATVGSTIGAYLTFRVARKAGQAYLDSKFGAARVATFLGLFRKWGTGTHAGVEFRGASGMTHELDVCIMRAEAADQCRQQPDDPPSASVVAGYECKFYAGNLQKGLGRAFVGLIDDMGTNLRLSGFCSNSVHPQLRDYFQPQRLPHPHFRMTPLAPSNEDIFVNQIKGELKKMTAS